MRGNIQLGGNNEFMSKEGKEWNTDETAISSH